eukprot:5577265-Amphidinium_carterae.1
MVWNYQLRRTWPDCRICICASKPPAVDSLSRIVQDVCQVLSIKLSRLLAIYQEGTKSMP